MIRACLAPVFLCALSAAGLAAAQTPAPSSLDCAAASVPDQRRDEETLRRIERGWLTAELHGDAQFLECLLEPDYRVSARDGTVRSRKELIDRVRQTTDSSREIPRLESIVFVHGDAASVHSILRTTDTSGKVKEVHFVDAYTFHDGRWYAFGGADL